MNKCAVCDLTDVNRGDVCQKCGWQDDDVDDINGYSAANDAFLDDERERWFVTQRWPHTGSEWEEWEVKPKGRTAQERWKF